MRPARALLLLALAFVTQAWAQGQGRLEATEAGVKAAFVYKFASYVEWPAGDFPGADAPFVFGVMGSDEVAAELERIVAGKSVNGRQGTVRRVKEGDNLAGIQALFVGRGQSNLGTVLQAARRPGLLVVTEADRGLEMGSAINLVVADERVGFEVSLEAAERNGLKVSSRMLNVARRVVTR